MIESFKEGNDIMKDIMNLPSDDSEDDDFDPDALTRDEDKMQESSNSDYLSDSEDSETSFKGEESKLPDVSVSESDAELDQGLADVPGRRNVERLDYKKLYDDEYENVSSSSSDDEDWDKTAGKEDFESADEGVTVPLKQSSEAEDHTSTKKPRRTSKRADKKDTLKAPEESPIENGCSGEKSSSSAYKQTNPKTQRLFKTFQENRYPDNATKELLSKELHMTMKQVNNWFRNRRSSTSKPLVTMVSKEDVEKLRTGQKKGETSVAGSSKQAMETDSVAENKVERSKMKKALRVYGGVLRLVRLLPADTRPYYAKYARENFVNYREVDVSETSLEELYQRAYNHSLWVLKKYSIDESTAEKMKEICFEQ
ncbi:unnamed protein product [Arabis nemorensis]|uniref:Homeobox domain-containing protein n=1 Tax=Arabis nemorensis TaxID=586526 RepID=A0A565BA17_9BRAS|nr:unnamed protein product [Arabis nemorensis]